MKENKKTTHKISIILILIIISFFFSPIRALFYEKNNSELIEKVSEYALPANIKIVQVDYINGVNSSSTSVSAGASGVIIHRENNKYYALTAEHVIRKPDDADKTQVIVIGYNDLDFNDYLSKGGKYVGIEDYYQQFSEAKVEYANEKYDLAIISFVAEKSYTVLSVSDGIPEKGDIVVSMSNPYGKRNIITAGKISSRKEKHFGDEAGKMQYSIIRHTSKISEGSSGSALLNENLEIVGINLGGATNLFHQHIYGMAMPSNRILDFLQEWKDEFTNMSQEVLP